MADARRTEVHRYLRGLFNVGTVAGLSDGELLDRFTARRGESAELAFAALVERHGPMVLRVCRKVLHDSDDAADAFQATFLVLARKAGSIRRRDSLGPYLHGVALRVANCTRSTAARRRKHERTYAERMENSYVAKPPDDVGRVLHEELGRLPERFRGVAVLCDLEGKTYVEAAGLLGCPPGTVMSRLAEARRRLRGRLTRRGLAPSAGAISAALAAETQATAKGLPAALAEATIQAATRFAAGPATPGAVVSASVTALTEGVLKAMFLTKLKSLAMLGLVGGVVATGAGVLAQAPGKPADPGDVTSAAPAGDRLQSLEKKLDRLLNVLESSAPKPSATAKKSSQSGRSIPTPKASAMPGMEGMMPGMMPGGMMSGTSSGMMPGGMMSGTSSGMMPGMGSGMGMGMMGSAKKPGMSDVEGRLERAERRLDELAGRLSRLERAVFVHDSTRLPAEPADPDLVPGTVRRVPANVPQPATPPLLGALPETTVGPAAPPIEPERSTPLAPLPVTPRTETQPLPTPNEEPSPPQVDNPF